MSSSDYSGNDHIALAHDLSILKDSGYVALSLNSAIEKVKKGELQKNSKYFCLTFDDGSPYDFYQKKLVCRK